MSGVASRLDNKLVYVRKVVNMARYIDVDTLIQKFNIDDMTNVNGCVPMLIIRRTIENAPTADVKPIITGEWQGYVCSICGVSSEYGSEYFCPSCGADMRKEVE